MEVEQRSKKSVHFEEAIGFEDQQFLDESIASLSEKQVEGSLCADDLEDLPDPVEPSEHDQHHNRGRYNLRKSLAWDSAFFTSAGFLDPEELSSMIIRADKPDKNMLCGIQEVAVSTESISTLGSDNLTLEALEDDLFVDIRASIQRSNWQSSNSTSSTSDKDPKNTNNTVNKGTTVKKELASQDKNNRLLVKKTSGIQSVRALKTPPNQIVRKLVPERQVNHGSANSQMNSGTRSTASNASKGTNRSASFSAETDKREVARNAHAKPECENPMPAVPARKASLQSKAPTISVARRGLPKPAMPLNSKSVQSLRSSASSDSSSVFSAPQAKSTAVRNPSRRSTKATGPLCPKTPSKVELRNKQPSSTLPNCLASTKTSSNPSPASSISEWSSVSSCSASRDNRISKTLRTSVDTVCVDSMKADMILDQRNHSAGKIVGVKTQDGNSSNSKKSLSQHEAQQASAKPSGLRMPTPKLGSSMG